MRKRVLLFATKLGYQTRSFDEAARALNVELAFVTDRCGRLDDPWNDGAFAAHFETPERAAQSVIEANQGRPVDGVLALGDRPTVTAAFVARALGIPYNHPSSVAACRNKLRMREAFRAAGLPTPWFREIPLSPIPEPALAGITFPCVLKPVSLSASQGVVRVNSAEEFKKQATRIRSLLQSPEVLATREAGLDSLLVEEYLPGEEVAVEGLIGNGEARILAIFDKPDPLQGPYFEETIYVTPSRHAPKILEQIRETFQSSVRALGLTHGPVHAEFRINEKGVWPLEVAARPIGGLCSRALQFQMSDRGNKISLEELLLRQALGESMENVWREREASGVMMIPVPQSGVLESVEGEEEARAVPGITALEITARVHDSVKAWPEGSSYLGFLFAKGQEASEVERALRAAHGKLHFNLVQTLPVEHPLAKGLRD